MRRSDVKTVEGILYDYPGICLSLSRRARELEAPGGGDDVGFVTGGVKTYEQERVFDVKQQDVEYCELLAVVERIGDAFSEGTAQMQEVIRRVFWQCECMEYLAAEMDIPTVTLYKKRYRAIHYMQYSCISVYPVVCRWRNREEERRLEAMNFFMRKAS